MTSPRDLTVSNPASSAATCSRPSSTPPEVAILGLNCVTERAVQVENGIAFHRHMTFSLPFSTTASTARRREVPTTLESHPRVRPELAGSERDRAWRRLTRRTAYAGGRATVLQPMPALHGLGGSRHGRPAASGGPSHPVRRRGRRRRRRGRRRDAPRGDTPTRQADRRDKSTGTRRSSSATSPSPRTFGGRRGGRGVRRHRRW